VGLGFGGQLLICDPIGSCQCYYGETLALIIIQRSASVSSKHKPEERPVSRTSLLVQSVFTLLHRQLLYRGACEP